MEEVLAEMSAVFSDLFERPIVLKPQMTAADIVGWDSFRHVEILMALEEKYAIDLPTTEVARARAVGDLALLIRAKLA